MSFGADLQGRISHEALGRLQDAEIRLLENIKACLLIRIQSDRQYAASLSKFVQQAHKVDNSDFLECCCFFRAWDTIVNETDKLVNQLKQNIETLSTKISDALTFVIHEKKVAKKFYQDGRNKLETEFSKMQDEVQKNKQEYSKTIDRLKLDTAKFMDIQTKGKSGGKLDDARAKKQKTFVKLHKLHNDYVISVKDVVEYQDGYLGRSLPGLLDCHQATQEVYLLQSKYVLTEYFRLTNLASSEYLSMYNTMESDLDKIDPSKEYTASFISKYKSEPIARLPFEFDDKLLDDSVGCPKSESLELNDLTLESLQHRKSAVSDELNACKKDLDQKNSTLQQLQQKVHSQQTKIHDIKCVEHVKEYVEHSKAYHMCKKELLELEASVGRLNALEDFISGPLDELGDDPPPATLDLQENGDLETCSNISSSSIGKKKKFSLGNVLRRQSEPRVKSSSRNSIDRDSKEDDVSVESASNDSSSKRQAATHSYEQHDPADMQANGPRSSMAIMRSESLLQDVGFPKPKGQLHLEEWFHGVLPREEVQRLLNNDGDYLVRESKNKKTNETQYVLSVYWQGYKHFIIQGSEGGWRFEGPSLPTIGELIYHQHCSGTPVTMKSQTILKKPILREEWELMNDDIFLEMKIGNGNFGEVYKGLYTPRNLVVAVKTCKDTLSEDQRKKFLQEGRILKQYDHPNIVQFIGIAAQRQPVMIIMEFVPGGALLSFLKKQGRSQSRKQLTQMCSDAANGMAYLAGKGCIHRDLAARNCLVGDENVVKISDFGMSREEQEYTVSEGMKQIPIKWTAPEALNYGRYTTMCDVWSYGILMWEIFSYGTTPYPGWPNAQAREKIEEGYRMPAPSGCSDDVYRLMKRCWEYQPEDRLKFDDIYSELEKILKRL
ncbi:tyrosine-protein kinase Fer-like [Gigantopelta aegis]|uniref:tyrosine-protein kinase Fer-like n=1 Tax=Gigantopelta aegis TaxID=1735272 RepID=UPI001B88796F|nr:tyrosine-protein kinase Fer-like [Gigantopelta aegis]